jgi:hypothetical protein
MSEGHLVSVRDTTAPYPEEPNFSNGLSNLWYALNRTRNLHFVVTLNLPQMLFLTFFPIRKLPLLSKFCTSGQFEDTSLNTLILKFMSNKQAGLPQLIIVSNRTHVNIGRLADWLLNKDDRSGLLRHMAKFVNLPSTSHSQVCEPAFCVTWPSCEPAFGISIFWNTSFRRYRYETCESCTVGHNWTIRVSLLIK